ncbi:MAG: ABC transporter permease subunit, partial [Verrucomicrobiales bacterium]
MVLPIVQRELRTAAKLKATYYGRLPGPAVAMFIILGVLINVREVMLVKNFNFLYFIISGILFLTAMAAGLRTSDAISSEKRNETLGLMFLTDLKGKDIILGKLVSNSTFDLYSLLAAAPVLYMTSFFGAIEWVNIVFTIVCLVNTMLLSSSIGLFVSCISFHQRKATSTTIGLLLVLAILLPGIAEAWRREPLLPISLDFLNLFSPGFAFGMTTPTARGLSTNYFWGATLVQFCLAILLLCISSFALPHLWQIKAPKEPWWRRMMRTLLHGSDAQKKCRRFRLLKLNPILWITTRNRLEVLMPWWLILFFGVIGFVVARKQGITGRNLIPVAIAELVVLNMIFLVGIGTLASRWLLQDRQTGALDLIVATPIEVATITKGIWTAVRRQYLPPLVLLLVVEVTIWCIMLQFISSRRQDLIDGTIIVTTLLILLHIG